MSRPWYNPNSDKWDIAWSATKTSNFSHVNHWIFLVLPWLILLLIFIFRRRLSGLSDRTKIIITSSLGAFAILWELWFDVASIVQKDGSTPWNQFVGGWDFCRMNTYIVGVFLILQRKELIKWVAATALFGGYSTLIDHYGQDTNHPTAGMHSLVTHTIILCTFAALAATMWGSNYKLRNLIHSHLFNYVLVAWMYFVVNNQWGGVAGELTKDRMGDNMLVGFAPWPLDMFLWIFAVMILEWAYFAVYRLIWTGTYGEKNYVWKQIFLRLFVWNKYKKGDLPKAMRGFGKAFKGSFKSEWPTDKNEWYGFKLWGKHSFYERKIIPALNFVVR